MATAASPAGNKASACAARRVCAFAPANDVTPPGRAPPPGLPGGGFPICSITHIVHIITY